MALLYVRNAADDGWILVNSSEGNKIYDSDGDTKIQCEESADEDIVRIDAGGNEIWMGLSSGEITKPLQPCFIAHATEDQVNIANSAIILFGTVVTDQGSDFAANTFTAPVTGTYQLNLNVYTEQVDGAYTYVRFLVVTSNQTYYNGVISPSQMNWAADLDRYGFNYSLLADMDEGDTAHVAVQFNAGAAQMEITNASYFSGSLIC
jgi:hypothetical protein